MGFRFAHNNFNVLGLPDQVGELGDGDGRQGADDRDDDHQLDEGEAAARGHAVKDSRSPAILPGVSSVTLD